MGLAVLFSYKFTKLTHSQVTNVATLTHRLNQSFFPVVIIQDYIIILIIIRSFVLVDTKLFYCVIACLSCALCVFCCVFFFIGYLLSMHMSLFSNWPIHFITIVNVLNNYTTITIIIPNSHCLTIYQPFENILKGFTQFFTYILVTFI